MIFVRIIRPSLSASLKCCPSLSIRNKRTLRIDPILAGSEIPSLLFCKYCPLSFTLYITFSRQTITCVWFPLLENETSLLFSCRDVLAHKHTHTRIVSECFQCANKYPPLLSITKKLLFTQIRALMIGCVKLRPWKDTNEWHSLLLAYFSFLVTLITSLAKTNTHTKHFEHLYHFLCL